MKIVMAAVLAAMIAAPAAADDKPTPEKYYATKCASCHGKDGKGNEKMAKMFKVEAKELDLIDHEAGEEADKEFVKAILEGKGKKMPAFKAKLGDIKAEDLLAYVKSLKAPKGKAK